MKKVFFFLTALFLSVGLYAGENDLRWDYTETAPGNSPDNGLTYGSKVNDAAGTNNGLKGVKMDDSGYCYFTKAAVAGKLKLTYSARSGSNETWLKVSHFPDGETPSTSNLTLIGETEHFTELRTATIELSAEQKNIYIQRGSGVQSVLTKIEFIETIARNFTDFEMVMCNMSEEYPAENVPEGVTFSGTFNNDQHGYRAFTITVPVDGTVKFTLGDCNYGDQPIRVKNKNGETIATLTYPQGGCYGSTTPDNVFVYLYVGEADTLTFGPVQYMNYFKAEAVEVQEATISYKDQNGTVLGSVVKYEGDPIGEVPYTVADLTIPEGQVFRGWVYATKYKVQASDVITGNTTIMALVTPMESVSVGSVQNYDLTLGTFYPEDHETFNVNGAAWHDAKHGFVLSNGNSLSLDVAGKAQIVFTLCKEGKAGATFSVSDAQGNVLEGMDAIVATDGDQIIYSYSGAATTLTFTLVNEGGQNYVHKISVYNVVDFLTKDEATGYYIVTANDAAGLLYAIVKVNEDGGGKIFLPNGTYYLGETTMTTITANNVAIIGESMTGTIIKNEPPVEMESIDKTSTLKVNKNVQNFYLQDLTLQNALDYYVNNNGRAVCLHDQGTKSICKNVRMLSYQDTYYSNLAGALKYFEDCEIHGTVDYICGDGKVYFKNNLLYCEKRNSNGGGSDAVTAANGPATDAYVFEGCTLKSECPTVSLGRAWNNTPTTIFLNTLVDYSAGQFSFTGSGISRWTEKLMNANAWPVFGEYNTHLSDGTVINPASNIVTFIDEKSGNATRQIETVLSAEQVANYSYSAIFGTAWDPAVIAAQTEVSDLNENNDIYSWTSDAAAFLVYADDELVVLTADKSFDASEYAGRTIYVRAANGRGGFGAKVSMGGSHTGVEDADSEIAAPVVRKYIDANGQIVIEKDGKRYNVLGF